MGWMRALTGSGAILGLVVGLAVAGPASAQRRRGPEPTEMQFRFWGPAQGNRIAAFAGIPGDETTYYAGASSGGVWKSTDGGNRWDPIFDKEPVATIGALAVAPSEPNTVWAGTGEAWAIRDIDVTGDGIYKSTDAGKTWTNVGLKETGRIGHIVVDPSDAGNVYVCALGRLGGPQPERGVYHTTDGGKTWTKSLFVDVNTGCSGLVMDPHDSKTLFAGMWQVKMNTWGEFSGGPGSGVFVTHDGGATWKRLEGRGLPKSPVGKIDVAVAPTDSKRVYALIETDKQGSVWRSDDGGETWKNTTWDRTLIGRAGYYIRIAVSPGDENKVLISNSGFHVSDDGGVTFHQVPWGGDNHDIWMDPKNPDHFAITFDGGLQITTVGGKGWKRVSLPIGQMYHVAVDDQIPYLVYTNMQDNSTMRGPSLPRGGSSFGIGGTQGWDFHMGGCESGFTLPDPTDPDVVWASCYADEVTRWDAKSHRARSVSPWFHTLDSQPDQTKYRCHWTPPLAIDPFDHNTVYYGCQVVFKTTDAGQSWTAASPDLSTRDPSRVVSSGGLIGDNLGQFYGEVVFAIAPSKIQRGLVWAGTNDGKVWYTRAGGGEWTDVSKSIPGMPDWGTITSIEPSHFDPGTAYISVDAHLVDDRDPYIYRTTDFGKSWTRIGSNLPKGPLAYVRNVSEDPNVKGLLFAGTGNALYYSLDDGGSWTRLKAGLPPSPVTWTVVQKRFHDLVVSTYGRGIYILDDITPLEQMAQHPTAEDVRLFAPRPAYRFQSPKAYIDFALKSKPAGEVALQILDPSGQVVRTLHPKAHEGLNRADWDLRYDALRTVELRTIPPENPFIWQDTRFKGKDWRPVTHWGMSPHQAGPLAAPGHYQVRLTVDGKSQTQPLELLIDPSSGGDAAGAERTFQMQVRIGKDVDRVSDMVNLMERQRHQLELMEAKLSSGGDAHMLAAVRAENEKIQGVEYEMFSKNLAPSDDKYYISAYKIYYNLLWLNGEVGAGAGDVAGGGDWGPTSTEPMLLSDIEQKLTTAEGHYHALMTAELPTFNRMLAGHHLEPLVMTLPQTADKDEGASDDDDYAADPDDPDDGA